MPCTEDGQRCAQNIHSLRAVHTMNEQTRQSIRVTTDISYCKTWTSHRCYYKDYCLLGCHYQCFGGIWCLIFTVIFPLTRRQYISTKHWLKFHQSIRGHIHIRFMYRHDGQPLEAIEFLEHLVVMISQERDTHMPEYRPHIITISVTREGSVYNYWGGTHIVCNLRPLPYSPLLFKLNAHTSMDAARDSSDGGVDKMIAYEGGCKPIYCIETSYCVLLINPLKLL